MTEPAVSLAVNDDSLQELIEQLGGVQREVEQVKNHLTDAMNRFQDVSNQVQDLFNDLAKVKRALGKHNEKLQILMPDRNNCPHCSRIVNHGREVCNWCLKRIPDSHWG